VLADESCHFAVRGAGHTPWAGASNIDNGVTIDLTSMNSVVVSEDRTIASLGPGARWEDVYRPLDEMNLTVTGGRVATVGVGGLVTGGGISYFSRKTGFSCDNVVNYEVRALAFTMNLFFLPLFPIHSYVLSIHQVELY
jgi:FAD/FMN-containing dehydrogenase